MTRKRRTGARLSGVLGIGTLLAVAAFGPALAQTGTKKTTHKKQSVSGSLSGRQGQADAAVPRPQQPAPKEAQQQSADLTVMLQRAVEDLTVVTLPDGTLMVDLDGGFQNVTMATFDDDGNLVLTCVDDLASAEALLQSNKVGRFNPRSRQKESGRKIESKRTPAAAEEK